MTLPPFQKLIEAHGRDVHRFLIAIVGHVDADDCYQETWLAALAAYPRMRDDTNLRSWLLTVAHNKAIDRVRARGRQAVPIGSVAEGALGAADAPDVAPDGNPDLWSEVRKLPPKQRTAVALRFVADAGYAEISLVMGTSEEAARRSIHEALKRLRLEYQP